MALFADRSAADEVTRRGRAVLDQVLDGLRARGMALEVPVEGGTLRHIGSPIHLSDTPPVAPHPARVAGADNAAILSELGFQP